MGWIDIWRRSKLEDGLRQSSGARKGPEAIALAQRLTRAAKRGDVQGVVAALAQGAEIDARDELGHTPLMNALRSGFSGAGQSARTLVNSGADTMAMAPSGDTPLHWAACVDDDESCRMLISHGASAEAQNDERETPLVVAARMGAGACAEALWPYSNPQSRLLARVWASRVDHSMAEWMHAAIEKDELSQEAAVLVGDEQARGSRRL